MHASQSPSPATARTGAPALRDVVEALRPKQWTKNAVVLAAFLFALFDPAQNLTLVGGLMLAIPATLLFCAVSSGVYLINDVRDLSADRVHPAKRFRPIAAGRVSTRCAIRLAAFLLVGGLVAAWFLSPPFAGVVAAYVVVQLLYSLGLKHVALLDVFVIAGGFVLRAIAGALVLAVDISPWLLLCAFLLALFLALCKRRHEKLATVEGSAASRASLENYDPGLLDILITISASATIVCYAIYTLSESTVEKFGTTHLGFTIPFVIFGVFRYLDLSYRLEKGDRPEQVLLTDPPTLINLALYGITLVVIFLLRG